MGERTNFLILTNGRSGSNNLVDLVNRHPRILNYGEVLGSWTSAWRRRALFGRAGDDPAAVTRYLNAFYDDPLVFYAAQAAALPSRLRNGRPPSLKRRGRVGAIGLKDFHLLFERRGVAGYVAARSDLKVIGLVRSNAVRRFLSSALLEQTGQVMSRGAAGPQTAKLNLPPEDFIAGVAAVDDENRRLQAALDALPESRRMVIDYVDYFGDGDIMAETNERVFRFLGVASIAAASAQRKLNSRRLADSIENYAEIRTAIAGTPFADAFAAAEIGG